MVGCSSRPAVAASCLSARKTVVAAADIARLIHAGREQTPRVLALGPKVIKQIRERIVQIAKANQVIEGRRMRVDTTVVETNIHPTDSGLLMPNLSANSPMH